LAQKLVGRGLLGLIGLEGGLALAYLVAIRRFGEAPHWLDFNGLRSLPSLLQATQLFAIGGLCWLVFRYRRRLPQPLSGVLPLALMGLCFYGGLDEITKLHLILHQYNWQVIYIVALVAIPLLGWRDLLRLWCHHRSTVLWVLAGITIFLLGGFGAEILKGAIATQVTAHASERAAFYSEHLRITVEELSELFGENLILYAFIRFLQPIWSPPVPAERPGQSTDRCAP
jgi:hypothetical protein